MNAHTRKKPAAYGMDELKRRIAQAILDCDLSDIPGLAQPDSPKPAVPPHHVTKGPFNYLLASIKGQHLRQQLDAVRKMVPDEIEQTLFFSAYEAMDCEDREVRAQHMTRMAGCALLILESESRA